MQYKTLSRWIYYLVFTLLIGISGSARAACLQSDLTGTWYANNFFVGLDGLGYWVRCKMVLNSSGNFNTTTSSCIIDVGLTMRIQGKMTVKSSCNVAPVTVNFYDDYGSYLGQSVMNYSNLDRGKTVISGVGDAGTPMPFILNAVKQ